MGMGGDLFRRKALILLVAVTALAGQTAAQAADATARVPDRAAAGRAVRSAADGGASAGELREPSAPGAIPSTELRATSPLPGAPRRGEDPEVAGGEAGGGLALSLAALLEVEAGNPVVQGFIREYQTRRRAEVEGALLRARLYRRFIAGRLDELGLPQELLFLPVIESGYRSRAVSRSGAAGLWQFMHNTARPFGMRVNDWVDERRDFWLATEAAARKLAENRRELGDWRLALAAYNCGLGALKRAVARAGTWDFWSLRAQGVLSRETAGYVPRFLAVSAIASHPARYGFDPDWERSPRWERIALDRSVDLRILARAAEVPWAVLRDGNAELNHPLTPTDLAGYRLKFPAEYRARVEAALADPQVQLVRLHPYRVRSGDTLYALARRYGVTVAMIRAYNPAVDPQRIRLGSSLFVPLVGDGPPPPEPPAGAAVPAGLLTGTYVVQPEDTLWAIAARFGTSPEALAWANGREIEATIRPGDVLKVPGGGTPGGDAERSRP